MPLFHCRTRSSAYLYYCVSGVVYRVANSTAVVMCEQQLGITLLIIGHNSRDSGISVLNTVWSGIVRYQPFISL